MLKDYIVDKPVLETERLILRRITENDVEDLREWLGLDEVYTYWGRKASKGERNPELLFLGDPRPWVKRKPTLEFKWGIELKRNKKLIGDISIFNIQNSRMGEVGYRLSPSYWNNGLVTEALSEVLRFIFLNTELDRISATANIKNIGSNRVLVKCGFIKEGCIRHGKMVSEYCDYSIYSMLAEDYNCIKNEH